MSGSRSTRGTGSGGPIQGASAWPSSFTGPARYSPPFNTDAADDQPTAHGEPYAPYADGAAEYADPYATADYEAQYGAESYGSESYNADSYDAESHRAESYAPESYSGGAYEPGAYPVAAAYEGEHHNEPYNYGGRGDYSADYAAPDFPAPTYVGDDYPAHAYDSQRFGEDAGYAGYAGGYEGTDGYGEPEPERGHTRLLTKPRLPELDDPESDRHADAGLGAAAFTPATDLGVPGPRQPESLRTRGGAQRQPQSGRGKVGWAGRTVQGLVLAALLGGVTAYVTFEKTVTVSVDGSTRQIHSFASTVGAALSSDNISTGSHDLVTPGPAASLSDNSTITVKYGRPITVSVNGSPEHVWVHAPTVGGAMQELGIRVQGARFVSVDPGTPIGRSGRDFAVYTMRHVTFLVDGKTDQVDTTAATVQDAMGQAGITLTNQDTAAVPMASLPTEGETISVLRITGTTEVKEVAIPYSTTKQNDPSSYVGTTTVVTAGQNGVAKVTYALQIINGVKQSPKEISRVVTKQPVAEVEKVGTKALPSSASGLNWGALANCESGGNPHAVDPSGSYYGLYQFSVSTWDSLGGSGLPSNASAGEQTTRAELLYQRSGAGQWPVCGHFLFS
ncbi:MAG TPA: ubiquitin-like domain-containing protein [Actinocrinis sp.]|nr:ubiquitin-like domain-containing protein [Actinocrinis sp.]